jgi:hypothetical protein
VFSYLINKMARLELKRMTIIYSNTIVIRKEMIWLSYCDVRVVS